jgi:hypothetical protein
MKRSLSTLGLVLLALAGCRDSSPNDSSPSPPASPAASPDTNDSQRDPIVLVADLSDEPARWEQVTTIAFGDGHRALSYVPSDESGPVQPRSFGVAPDGSFWVLDPGKERAAHFSRNGTFLEAVGGLGPEVQDMVFLDDLMLVLESQDGRVTIVDRDGGLIHAVVNDGRDPLRLRELVASGEQILAQVGDPIEDAEGAGRGFAQIELPGSGLATPVPGLPAGESWVLPVVLGPEDLEIRYIGEETSSIQPIHIEIRRGGELLDGIAGVGNFIVVGEDLAAHVSISASAGDDQGEPGGHWLLRIGDGPLLWERLLDPTIDVDQQVRHIGAGSDGSLYLLIQSEKGVAILRRP